MAKKIEIPLMIEGQFNPLYIIPFGGMKSDFIRYIFTAAGTCFDMDNEDLLQSFECWHNSRTVTKKGVSTFRNYISIVKQFKDLQQCDVIKVLDFASSKGYLGIDITWDCYSKIINGNKQTQHAQPQQRNGNTQTNNIQHLFSKF